ncbi:hypothetical protein Tcan_02600 [Toxocara canis]|uniref:Uncharacterized protein n=1 Tax=Toxocara canis TaxID=6265 RepID=A0A0B2VLC7_TOXCA|nr:hypothetical protein Tcan_02600 [Toxocara canis]
MDVSLGSEENAVMRGSSSLTPSNMRSPCGEGYSSGLSGLNSMGSPDVSSYRLMSASATRPTMRSLSAAYNAADSQFSVQAQRQPLKDQGLLQKLWNYLA